MDTVCIIYIISLQLNPLDPGVLPRESNKDPTISNVMRYTREGWSQKGGLQEDTTLEIFQKLAVSLSTAHGYLLYGSRVVIPSSLRPQVLQLRDILACKG